MHKSTIRIMTGATVALLIGAAAALPVAAAQSTPAAAPLVDIASPNNGDYVRRGQEWVIGVACDPNAPASDPTAGIARIAVYLGDRDTLEGAPSWRPGGYMGAATAGNTFITSDNGYGQFSRLGLQSPDVSVCKQPNSAFRILPSSFRKGDWTMNVYVTAKNGMETKYTVGTLHVDKP
jgi:hypothetical protein